MNSTSNAYKKMVNLFGEDLTNSIFPELGISEALIEISAILQMICNILITKGVISKEEYLKYFSDEELEKMVSKIKEQSNL